MVLLRTTAGIVAFRFGLVFGTKRKCVGMLVGCAGVAFSVLSHPTIQTSLLYVVTLIVGRVFPNTAHFKPGHFSRNDSHLLRSTSNFAFFSFVGSIPRRTRSWSVPGSPTLTVYFPSRKTFGRNEFPLMRNV